MASHSRVADDDPAIATCSLRYIQRQLGADGMSDRRALSYVRQLIEEKHFPTPLPVRIGTRLVDEPVVKSRWMRAAVDAWFAGFLSPDAADMADRKAMQAAAADMDGNAGNLRLVAGRDLRSARA